jgi:Esterase-like activity of phytase
MAAGAADRNPPEFALSAESFWLLETPGKERFDASGLLLLPDGALLTVNDRHAGLYRVNFRRGTNIADLVALPDCFTTAHLAPFAGAKVGRWDCEGIARDDLGRLYLCEEANRWILRWDQSAQSVEPLAIDWSPAKPYFTTSDINASFEGVAIGRGKLYVANERQRGRIIVVDLATLQVERHFQVSYRASRAFDTHYSDLCWHNDTLWVLLRESSALLQLDPLKETVLAEFSFRDLERRKEVIYTGKYPTGIMEGLAVDDEFIWLVTDNNGEARWSAPGDTRPTLFKCRRPDRKAAR